MINISDENLLRDNPNHISKHFSNHFSNVAKKLEKKSRHQRNSLQITSNNPFKTAFS